MYRDCQSIEEIISKIFEQALDISYQRNSREGDTYGYYLSLKSVPSEKINGLPQLIRLFYNAQSKGNKRMLGSTCTTDRENTFGEALSYIYECLYNVFNGNLERLGERLICKSINDVKALLNDEKAVKELCSYCIVYVDRRFMSYCKTGANPDYYYETKENAHKRIDYFYLDDSKGEEQSRYDILEESIFESETGEITEYILDNYMNKLTSKEQLFCQCWLTFGQRRSGDIRDLEERVLYSRQDSYKYRKQIKNKVLKMLEEDEFLDIEGTFIWREMAKNVGEEVRQGL